MIRTIEPFMKLGWHTVPLQGELKRLENGKKTAPSFEPAWKDKYTQNINTTNSKLGGTITGKVSGIIAIDCDNTVTYEIFKQLDPDYKFHFISSGKKDKSGIEQESGTIIYKYADYTETYSMHNTTMSLDFYSDGGFVYLPTEANKTKLPFELCDLKEAPASVIALVRSLKPVKLERAIQPLVNKGWVNHLEPQVSRFVSTKKIIPELFKVLTPYDFRTMDEYLTRGYVVPDDIHEGRGSDYLMRVSAILGADESIDVELYQNAMGLINQFFSTPMQKKTLQDTITDPMSEGRSKFGDKVIWQYNEDWKARKIMLVTKRQSINEAFFDPHRVKYYLADVANSDLKSFKHENEFYSYISTVMISPPDMTEVKEKLPLIDVTSTPAKEFGFYEDEYTAAFNAFVPSIPLSIFKDPKRWASNYTRPINTINYLQSLVPDNFMRNYLLGFLRRKLDTFEYSPTILYFLGVGGAGKDTFVSIIEQLIGTAGMARPTTKEFLEMYNAWLLDKYFVQLDEYGNQLVRFDEKEAALGKIKAYTGKPEVQIRQMRTDGFNYYHSATFVITANKNPLMPDSDDRRLALFNCPNKLSTQVWVQAAGGMAAVYERIQAEINDFAYYLATEVENCSKDEYMQPPETEDKKIMIASSFSAGGKLAYLLSSGMFVELEKIARQNDCMNIFTGSHESRIYEDDLFALYDEMTEGKGTKRGLSAAMKEFDKVPTTYKGQKAYYYHIPTLKGFKYSAMGVIDSEDDDLSGVLNT